MKFLILLLSSAMLCGCVSMIVQKEVQVKKDANGKVIETVEKEQATERVLTFRGFQLDHLKNKATDEQPPAI